uniref:RxLR effector candidate protein n=1 Tax=Hyaloperonospora arabidopsidis (strain Emoy2) TaxID=559515 RepID=M4C2W5_HYAAE
MFIDRINSRDSEKIDLYSSAKAHFGDGKLADAVMRAQLDTDTANEAIKMKVRLFKEWEDEFHDDTGRLVAKLTAKDDVTGERALEIADENDRRN